MGRRAAKHIVLTSGGTQVNVGYGDDILPFEVEDFMWLTGEERAPRVVSRNGDTFSWSVLASDMKDKDGKPQSDFHFTVYGLSHLGEFELFDYHSYTTGGKMPPFTVEVPHPNMASGTGVGTGFVGFTAYEARLTDTLFNMGLGAMGGLCNNPMYDPYREGKVSVGKKDPIEAFNPLNI